MLTPEQLLHHIDQGTLWPIGAGEAFTNTAAAYQTALQVRKLRQARGERPVGYKIGFTNRSIWARYQVFAPIWGTVWDSSLSFADGPTPLSLAHTCQPRIEPELVLAFKQPPPMGCTVQQLFESLDWAAPGFEIVQCHLPDWTFQAAQTMADSGLHARLRVGSRVPVTALAQDAAGLHKRLGQARCTLFQDNKRVDEGPGANVLDSPLMALLHFVAELRACAGAPDVAAGDVVTTGTWTDAWPVLPGQTWRLAITEGLPDLRVTLT